MMNKIAAAAVVVSLALTAGTSASAAVVVGAKSVEITNALPDYLQVSELVANTFSNIDVALATDGATATASSVYQNGPAVPGKAIDGVFPTDYPNIFHSNGSGAGEFLLVTFAAPQTLASLTIYGRNGCCRDRDLFNFKIFNAAGGLITSGQLDSRPPGSLDTSSTVTFERPVGGVPEPASWALMLVGFGGLGAVLRRRRGQVAEAA
jgi:hypothetical protein